MSETIDNNWIYATKQEMRSKALKALEIAKELDKIKQLKKQSK